MSSRKEKLEVCTYSDKRLFEASELQATAKDRIVSLCFASELPVRRAYGYEVLVCSPDSVDLDRINHKASLLFNHDAGQVIGVVEGARIDSDKRARASVKISVNRSDILNDIRDKVLNLVSVGYETTKLLRVEEKDGEKYYYWSWSPYEVSIVSIPADYKEAGIGRNKDSDSIGSLKQAAIKAEITSRGKDKMTEDIKEIMSLAKANNAYDLANEVINKGGDINEFRALLLNKISNESAKKQDVVKEMEQRTGKRYSFAKAVLTQIPGTKIDAGFEIEVSNEIAKRSGRQATGLFIPSNAFQRAVTTTGVNDFIAQGIGETIEVLRNELVAGKLGVQMISLSGSGIKLPKPSATSAYWVGEGSDYTESTFTTDGVEIGVKQVGGYVDVTKQSLMQAAMSISLESMLLKDLTDAVYEKVDNALINGTGTYQLTGLLNTSGIHTVTVTPEAPTMSQMIGFEAAILGANIRTDNLMWLIAPDTFATLVGTQAYSGGGVGLLDLASKTIAGRPYIVSNVCPQGKAILGAWDNLILATFSDIDLTVDTASLSKSQGLRLVAGMLVGSGVKRPEAFAVGAVEDNESSSSD